MPAGTERGLSFNAAFRVQHEGCLSYSAIYLSLLTYIGHNFNAVVFCSAQARCRGVNSREKSSARTRPHTWPVKVYWQSKQENLAALFQLLHQGTNKGVLAEASFHFVLGSGRWLQHQL